MTRPIVRSGQHQISVTIEKWKDWRQTWVRSQVPGVIRHICEYKCHVNCLVIDFKIILMEKQTYDFVTVKFNYYVILVNLFFCHHNFRLSEPIPRILALPNNFKEYNV